MKASTKAQNSPEQQKRRQRAPTPGSWPTGRSGNPGGRPKESAHVRELARQHTAEAISTLAAIMRDPEEPAAARARSAEVLLNRAWGTPETTTNVNLSAEPTTEQLIQIILGDPELAAIIGAKIDSGGSVH
jgi:hypothetical protein